MTTKQQLVIRTGCLSCRAREVRCDPSNPDCQRNSSTKWVSNRAMTRRRTSKTNPIIWNTEVGPSITSLEFTWEGTLRERQSLHFFCVISAPELSGLLDAKFWQMLLLQATLSDEAIKHAVAAIGASHEHLLRKQASRINAETDGLHGFALRQCNKAIKDLVKPVKTVSQCDLMRALTASVLFACFESLSGNRNGAVPHIVHSRRILEQEKKDQLEQNHSRLSESFPVKLDIVKPLVAHLEVQIGSFVYESNPDGLMNTFNLDDSLEFSRLSDARESLERAIANMSMLIWDLEAHHSFDDVAAAARERSEYFAWLRGWDSAFSNYLAQQGVTLDKETMNGCRLLKAHQLAAMTLAGADYMLGEEAWASFIPQYAAIVKLIAEIVDTLPKRGVTSEPPQTPYLSATMGMTEPLYCTATRCSDPTIAMKAKSLLTKLPLNEGAHSSWKISYIEKTLCAATGRYHQ